MNTVLPCESAEVKALRASEVRYRRLFESAKDGVLILDADTGMVVDVNPFLIQLLGLTHEDFLDKKVWELGLFKDIAANEAKFAELQAKDYVRYEGLPLETSDGRKIEVEFVSNVYLVNGQRVIQCNIRDITARKLVEKRELLVNDVLAVLNRPNNITNIIRDILMLLKQQTGIEAVGIRLKEGEDFPYTQTDGFPDHFIQREKYLCARDGAGQIVRDAQGQPVLECMCGNILRGRFDPTLPFFTAAGSFWTNGTTELLASTSEADRQARSLNRCNTAGHESVALIPLRARGEIIGLLQLNDHRRNQFSLSRITFLEGIGASIGIALTRLREDEQSRENENQFRLLFEANSDGIVMVDVETKMFTRVNAAMCRMLGYTLEEFSALHVEDLHPKVDLPVIMADFAATGRGEMHGARTLRCLRKDGQIIHAEVNATLVLLAGRTYNLAIFRDISERKRSEDAVRASEARLRAFCAAMPDVGLLLDEDGRYVEVLTASDHLLYKGAAALVGRTIPEIFPADQAALFMGVIRRTLETGKVQTLEYSISLEAGQTWFEGNTAPVTSIKSARRMVVFLARDITARKQAEDALRASEHEFHSLAESMPQIVWIARPDGGNIYFNQQWVDYTGLTLEDSYGHGWLTPFHPDDKPRAWEAWQRAAQRKDIYSVECRLRRADGAYHWWLIRGVPLRDAEGGILKWFGTCTDIETIKQTEAALVLSEAEQRQIAGQLEAERTRLVTAQRVARIGSWETDLSTLAVIWSEETHRIFETNPATFQPTHQDFLGFVHPDDRAMVDEAFARSFGRPEPQAIEHRLVMPDGRVKVVEESWQSFFDAAGRPLRAAGTCQDISERKRAEEAARQSEENYRSVISAANDGFWLLDRTGRLLDVNEAYCRLTGYSREQLLAMRIADVEMAEDPEAVKHHIERIVATGSDRFETRHRCADGRWVELEVSANYAADRGHLFAFFRDITERRRTMESQARLVTAVEQASETIVITDPTGAIRYANPAFEKITGYARAETIGQNSRMLQSGKQDAEFYRKMWATLTAGQVWRGHFTNKRKDGTLFEEEATISPVLDVAGKVINYVAVKRDVTREVALEAQNRQIAKMDAVGQLAGGVAHDFNNKLQIIMGSVEMALQSIPPSHPSRPDLLEIQEAARRSADLTRQLLAFSRQQSISPVLLDLNVAISGSLKMLGRLIGENIRLRFTPQADLGPVLMDPSQLDQVLVNLAVNARDAIAGVGSITLEAINRTLEATDCADMPDFVAPGDYVALSFRDDGAGMTPEIQAHIFEPFYTTKEVGKGTGLGLATVYGIVKQNGGAIGVQSVPGQGTTFTLLLPRSSGAVLAAAEEAMERMPTGSETILVIEDDEGILNLVQRTLVKQGYRVLTALLPRLALEVCTHYPEPIHLLLTDVIMPEMSGKELAERIGKLRPGVRVLYMSGYSAAIMEHQGHLAAGPYILQKPFTATALAQHVRAALDQART